jgi:hypothetical protein
MYLGTSSKSEAQAISFLVVLPIYVAFGVIATVLWVVGRRPHVVGLALLSAAVFLFCSFFLCIVFGLSISEREKEKTNWAANEDRGQSYRQGSVYEYRNASFNLEKNQLVRSRPITDNSNNPPCSVVLFDSFALIFDGNKSYVSDGSKSIAVEFSGAVTNGKPEAGSFSYEGKTYYVDPKTWQGNLRGLNKQSPYPFQNPKMLDAIAPLALIPKPLQLGVNGVEWFGCKAYDFFELILDKVTSPRLFGNNELPRCL